MILLYAVVIALLITTCAVVHEGGHYLAARRFGIDVVDFSIGMGKPVKQWTGKTGTTYTLKMFPVGGSVSPRGMTVEEVEESGEPREGTYIYAPPMQRLAMTVAGVLSNILFAVLIEFIVIPIYMQPSSWEEVFKIPSAVALATLGIIGAFIHMLVTAPLNGFSDLASVVSAPSAMQDSANTASETGMPGLMLIAIALIALNLFMAVFNILPIFPLDGFYAVTAAVDGARKSVHAKGESTYVPLTYSRLKVFVYVGYTAIFGLATMLFFRDIFTAIVSLGQ